MATGEFSVATFFTDGTYNYDIRYTTADIAVNMLKSISQSVGCRILGVVERIIVTDGGDNINVEWQKGKGIVFPPPPEGAAWEN